MMGFSHSLPFFPNASRTVYIYCAENLAFFYHQLDAFERLCDESAILTFTAIGFCFKNIHTPFLSLSGGLSFVIAIIAS